MTAAAFLDRDGTLIADYLDGEWADQIRPEWLPGAQLAVRRLAEAGYVIVVVTNQYLIGEGFIAQSMYESFAKVFRSELEPFATNGLAIYSCPHARWARCTCIKPMPGMIHAAQRDFPALDLNRSLLVGDSDVDMQLARRMGMQAYGIGRPRSPGVTPVASLLDATQIILGE